MAVRRAVLTPLIIGAISAMAVVVLVYVFLQQNLELKTEQLRKTKIELVRALATRTELRIENAANLLTVTAKAPQVQENYFSDLISEQTKGIPLEADPEKRAMQQAVLSSGVFETVAFLMPNGDVYSVEPSTTQKNLQTVNFAYREYYVNVMRLQSTYVSEVLFSTATNRNAVVIATPVFKDRSQTGIWVGAMDLAVLSDKLKELNLGSGQVAIIIDHSGRAIASSDEIDNTQIKTTSYSYLQSAQKVVAGETGTGIEYINGTQMYIAYSPVVVAGNTWAVLVTQPIREAYMEIYALQQQAIAIVGTVVAILAFSSFLLFRSNVQNIHLSDRVERANEELKRVDKSKEEFSSMITHELKTPLVPIIGYGNLLLGGRLGDLNKTQKEKISIIYDNAQRLSRLIQDVLDVRKLELGRIKLDLRQVSVNELIDRSVHAFSLAAEAKGIRLEDRLRSSLIDNGKDQKSIETMKVRCDPGRIHQIFDNLISNAIKFVPEHGGHIEVDATVPSDEDGVVVFSVKDNGIGISAENQSRLFNKFYQVDTSLTRNAGGSGLGLTIARGLVEAHGGRLWLQSQEGKGSIFFFSLPIGGENVK